MSWEPRGLPASWRLLRPSSEALRAAPGPAGAGGRLPGPGSGLALAPGAWDVFLVKQANCLTSGKC